MRFSKLTWILAIVLVVVAVVLAIIGVYHLQKRSDSQRTLDNASSVLASNGYANFHLDTPEYNVPLTGVVREGVCDFPITFLNFGDEYLLEAPEGFAKPLFAMRNPRVDDLRSDVVPRDIKQRCFGVTE